jgi:hypothetical protein
LYVGINIIGGKENDKKKGDVCFYSSLLEGCDEKVTHQHVSIRWRKLVKENNDEILLTGSAGEVWAEPSPSPCSLTHQPNSLNESSEDSYVMQMLTSPSSVVQQQHVISSSSPSLNHPIISSSDHRHQTASAAAPITVAISPEEVAMRMLDYYTVHLHFLGRYFCYCVMRIQAIDEFLFIYLFIFFQISRVLTHRAETMRKLPK